MQKIELLDEIGIAREEIEKLKFLLGVASQECDLEDERFAGMQYRTLVRYVDIFFDYTITALNKLNCLTERINEDE